MARSCMTDSEPLPEFILQVLDLGAQFDIWRLPKVRATMLGVPMKRIIAFRGPCRGPLSGKSHIDLIGANALTLFLGTGAKLPTI